jgi:hypothetical protein
VLSPLFPLSPDFVKAATLAAVGNIEAASLKDDRDRMDDTASFSLALGTDSYRFLIKPLLSLKMAVAIRTLILIYGHYFTSHKPFRSSCLR